MSGIVDFSGQSCLTRCMITKSTLIKELGSGAALARVAEVSRQSVDQWGEQVPVARCPVIQRNTRGRYTIYSLRPDVFGPGPDIAPTGQEQPA